MCEDTVDICDDFENKTQAKMMTTGILRIVHYYAYTFYIEPEHLCLYCEEKNIDIDRSRRILYEDVHCTLYNLYLFR